MATATNLILIREYTPAVFFELWISDQHNLESRLAGQVDGVASVILDSIHPDLYQIYVDPRWETNLVVEGVVEYLRDKLSGTVLAGKSTPKVETTFALDILDTPCILDVPRKARQGPPSGGE